MSVSHGSDRVPGSPGGPRGLGGLRPRDRRAVVVGGLILGIAVMVRFVLLPYVAEIRMLGESVDVQREALARELGLVRELDHFGDRAAEVEASVERWAPSLVPADPLDGSSALSDHLAGLARESGILLQRIDGSGTTTPASTEDLVVHAVTLQALGDLEGVLRFLHAMENGTVLLEVRGMTLGPSPLRSASPEEAPALRLSAEVRAFALPSSVARPAAPAPAAVSMEGAR